MTTKTLAEQIGLDYQQIVRIESEYSFADNRVVKEGTSGSAYVLLRLLEYYKKRVSLDELFNPNIAFHDITIDPISNTDVQKELIKRKLQSLTEVMEDINSIL